MSAIHEIKVDPKAFDEDYLKPIHRVGTILSTGIFFALFLPSIFFVYLPSGFSGLANDRGRLCSGDDLCRSFLF